MRGRFITEVVEQKKRALVVHRGNTGLADYIRSRLIDAHEVYETSYHRDSEPDFTNYDMAIFIDVFPSRPSVLRANRLNVFFFFYNESLYISKLAWCKKNLKDYKAVYIEKTKRSLKEIVEFVLFKTPSPYYFSYKKQVEFHPIQHLEVNPKKIIYRIWFWLITGLIVLNLIFLVSFSYELWLLFSAAAQIQKGKSFPHTQLASLRHVNDLNETLVLIPKNTLFWVPGMGNLTRFYETINKTNEFLFTTEQVAENYAILARLFLKQNKTNAERQEAKLRIAFVQKKIDEVGDMYYAILTDWRNTHLLLFDSYRQSFLDRATEFDSYLGAVRTITKELAYLTGAEEHRRYLILFMNNMELRPGGGFIGSLGVVDFYDFSMKEIHLYDVYTLDGQLKIHVDPPPAIAKYMAQPHWFLRDSNFSPDFPQNTKQALKFIKSEVNWDGFDGVIGITFTTVQRLISLFPDLYVAGYNERVTPDNFFIKAQSYAENEFFPGSHSKRNFLESVVRSLLVRFDGGDFDRAGLALLVRQLLDEKQIALYFEKQELQSAFDKLFWTGRVVRPGCSIDSNCFSDYLMVNDANLGINKANFFIQRSIRLITEINSKQQVVNTLILNYKNESIPNVFPGGEYRNYLQIYIPREVKILGAWTDGKKDYYDEGVDLGYSRINMWMTLKEGQQKVIELKYMFSNKFDKTKPYQLIMQKQIGSINTDFIYEMRLPHYLSLKDSNFTPVVSSEGFVYNTFLEKDRLLLIWFQ